MFAVIRLSRQDGATRLADFFGAPRDALALVLVGLTLNATATAQTMSEARVQTRASQSAMTPDKALALLKQGNARFLSGAARRRDFRADVRATAEGQYPFAAILSCMDSRGPVELIFDQTVGEVFSVRVAGNVVSDDVLASLEYATKFAHAKLVLVLGHTRCGAVKGAIDGVKLGNLTGLLDKISPAVAAADPGSPQDQGYVDRVAEQNVRLVVKELREKSPVLRDLLSAQAIRLVGGMYDVAMGRVRFSE
jgi:carbonic anhydrase